MGHYYIAELTNVMSLRIKQVLEVGRDMPKYYIVHHY